MKKKLLAVSAGLVAALVLGACGNVTDTETPGDKPDNSSTPQAGNIKLWLAGEDTPQELRDYLKETFETQNPGSTLTIETIGWS
ncbi:MAG: hypothetical protein LBE08_07285, partial [Bifidobacteriaceae bacterium]|nr:hypothetical protein [Bifidobacteriaceae bacterium]